jgi:large subunit ribosomal protein L18
MLVKLYVRKLVKPLVNKIYKIFKFLPGSIRKINKKKMNPIVKTERRKSIRHRIRRKVSGVATKPRLSVFRSNTEIYAQLVDDQNGVTLAAASSKEKDIVAQKVSKSEKSKLVGASIAKKAAEIGITDAKFDRGGYLYHGRVKALADGAREGGLKF